MSLPDGMTRELSEAERWGRAYFSRELGATIKERERCQAPNLGCVSNATMLWGKKKLCRTHVRIAKEGRL